MPNFYESFQKEGVGFTVLTAGEFKRTLTPVTEIEDKHIEKEHEGPC
jgi:ClpP class serine protease